MELWLGRILAKCGSQSGEGHTNTSDNVYSLRSMPVTWT